MDLSFISDYVMLGGFSAVIVAIILTFATQYKFFFCETDKVTSKTLNKSTSGKPLEDENKARTEEEILKDLGYSQERLSKIANYAQILHEYEPSEEIGAGENEKQEAAGIAKAFPCTSKHQDLVNEADSINDCDSLTVNLPEEDDQDDIDMSDMTYDYIPIDEDLEDDVDGQISEQALADIVAELKRESSLLNESFEEQTKPDTEKEKTEDEEAQPAVEVGNNEPTREELLSVLRVQQKQLTEMLELMEFHPEMFGVTTGGVMHSQVHLRPMLTSDSSTD